MSQSTKTENPDTGDAREAAAKAAAEAAKVAEAALWKLIPLSDFNPPVGATPEVVRSGLHDLWRRLRGRDAHPTGGENDVEMERPSQKLLDWAVPPPDWRSEETVGLARTLDEWLGDESVAAGVRTVGVRTVGVRTVVDAPIAIVRERLAEWATAKGYFLVEPPTREQVLAVDEEWLDAIPLDSGQRLILPRLERCFLRHRNGLELLRRLLDRIDRFQPTLLAVCQSWAWRYLCQVEKIDALLGTPLTPAPFGDEEMFRWLGSAARNVGPYEFIFREASSGVRVLGTSDPDSGEQSKPSSFLKNLAARSRGNPRIAGAIWRSNLLATKDDAVEEDAQEAAKEDKGVTLWVRPWDQIHLPDMAGDASSLDAMVLCTLLQHGGLAQGFVVDLLPVAPSDVIDRLHKLRLARLVEQVDGEWQPTTTGYPVVRRFLAEEGYLIDEL